MGRTRTFLAVDLGKTVRERAVALQQRLARGRHGSEVGRAGESPRHALVPGRSRRPRDAGVCRIASDCTASHASFSMSIESVGCFPNPRRPRILWIGVGEGAQPLCADPRCAGDPAGGPRLSARGCRYTPHATLGRVRGDHPTEELARALAHEAAWKGGETVVREILIMGSELTPRGTDVYRARQGMARRRRVIALRCQP